MLLSKDIDKETNFISIKVGMSNQSAFSVGGIVMYMMVVTRTSDGVPVYSFTYKFLYDAEAAIDLITAKREFGDCKYLFSIFQINGSSKKLIKKTEK